MVRNVKGFTMVELMIVIAIIGVLATALIPSLIGAQSKARDTSRQTHLTSISNVLDGYYQDNSAFPSLVTSTSRCVSTSNWGITTLTGTITTQTDLAKSIKWGIFPTDPQASYNDLCSSTNKGAYWYKPLTRSSTDTTPSYVLFAKIENSKNANILSGSSLSGASYADVVVASRLTASGAGYFKTY